ncbi:hypothetical protein DLAC_03671 [Tieghemostelium lacteum]|uniref:Uncharacterized protein n=1 Tax=Tieghemostelium lacteum TaxID=361077 RepID=A0A152A0E8_TIELA|nr:hypothetical protein DLAC_03671 [Tieghemostelium lacteum]|eukprot:KYQ99731.1 hypothetical protein DLAC_03671 [Tieghemostelium lacteum]
MNQLVLFGLLSLLVVVNSQQPTQLSLFYHNYTLDSFAILTYNIENGNKIGNTQIANILPVNALNSVLKTDSNGNYYILAEIDSWNSSYAIYCISPEGTFINATTTVQEGVADSAIFTGYGYDSDENIVMIVSQNPDYLLPVLSVFDFNTPSNSYLVNVSESFDGTPVGAYDPVTKNYYVFDQGYLLTYNIESKELLEPVYLNNFEQAFINTFMIVYNQQLYIVGEYPGPLFIIYLVDISSGSIKQVFETADFLPQSDGEFFWQSSNYLVMITQSKLFVDPIFITLDLNTMTVVSNTSIVDFPFTYGSTTYIPGWTY